MSDHDPIDATLDQQGEVPKSATPVSSHRLRIGRYRVEGVLGKGSFGVVYLTHDEQLNRLVAVKVPHSELTTRSEDAEIYIEEARAVANLDHPNIVPVYDVNQTDDCPCYIVSKYIEGIDLATKLSRSPLDSWRSAELIATLAEALHYAHKQGLVHRDVKPGNVLIDSDGKPYIVDFGLALSEANIGQGAKYVGTPAYMSPEQARGEGHRVDGRSDIFSLGVMFYELLAGRRPFRGDTLTEISNQVINLETKPLRQLNDAIPKELERICLKAMSKRSSERYTTAQDMADDLWQYLAENSAGTAVPDSSPTAASNSTAKSTVQRKSASITTAARTTAASAALDMGSIGQGIKMVPKGLRSFDEHDADFFLELLPGPRDRRGLPDSLRFWKTRLEETDPTKTFTVGLICGPSGCGKSSFVKAGLLPRLSAEVIPVYVEATAGETETRLLNGLRRACPGLPQDQTLKATVALLRQGSGISANRKVVLIVDQFEQWLHANGDQDNSELLGALRQCDAGRVQCVLMVRDDFWMAVIRFMRELEVRLLEGENTAAIDLFEPEHARKVLAAFGRAFDKLPESLKDTTREQRDFLKQAVDGLTEEGKVICVRLALFADMMKNRPWTPASLKQVGGTQGIGATFLEEMFGAATTVPQHRYHQRAAREILKALLPESGTNIKGHMRSYEELLELSGYDRRPQDFEDLIKILDNEIRLITPTDPAGAEIGDKTAFVGNTRQKYYQLTHDYLVHSLRDWLTRKQKETRRGRAQLDLAERALLWNTKKDAQQIPSVPVWLNIRVHTKKSEWSASEVAMMRAAGKYHSARMGFVALVLLAAILLGAYFWNHAAEQNLEAQAVVLVKRLADAETREVPKIVADLKPFRRRVNPKLVALLDQSEDKSKAKLHAALGLLAEDKTQLEYLTNRLLYSTPQEILTIRSFLASHEDAIATLWKRYEAENISDLERFRLATALASLDASNSRWSELGGQMALRLVNEPLSEVAAWIENLRPIKRFLLEPLCEIFGDAARDETERLVAANVLADYEGANVELLTQLILDADTKQFSSLLPKLELNSAQAIAALEIELAKSADFKWTELQTADWEEPSEQISASLEAADGMLTPEFAIAQTLPLEAFDRVSKELSIYGYRPERFRPYGTQSDGVRVAALWTRDGRDSIALYDKTPQQIVAENELLREREYYPLDVAFYDSLQAGGPSVRRYAALWGKDCDQFDDSAMFVGVPTSEHAKAYGPLLEGGFVPFTDLKDEAADRETWHSSVRWKLKKYPWVIDHEDDLANAKRLSANDWYQADVRILTGLAGEARFAGTWWPGMNYKTETIQGLSPLEHRKEFQRMRDANFRPLSISVSSVPGESRLLAASVWRHPTVDENAADKLYKRKANAALAVARLGRQDVLWPLLSLKPNPALRAHLINRIQVYGLPWLDVMDRLRYLENKSSEAFTSQRRALLLALSDFDLPQIPFSQQAAVLTEIETMYRGDPDPGIHAAAEVVLRRWNHSELVQQIDEELQQVDAALNGKIPLDRNWYLTAAGQSMAVVSSFEEWMMGSPGHEPMRIQHMELLHPKLLRRRIAVSTKEITAKQFLEFRPAYDFARQYCPTDDCPIIMVSWFDAVKYCRWLSEKENIPEDQMCYPPMDDIRPGMKMPADYLRRRGYRLLTEAEWEFACRAGTTSSHYFGDSPELLLRYAFTNQNSGNVGSPVGSLLPNDFGLFDMLGNAFEWCQNATIDPDLGYRPSPFGVDPLNDPEDLGEITERGLRIVRGGSFLYEPSAARAAHRDNHYASTRQAAYLGFRIARTVTD